MRRALAALAALALALTPTALASAKKKPTLKQRCAKSAYAKHHRRQCAKYKKKRTSQTKTTTQTQTTGPQAPSPVSPSPAPTATPGPPPAPTSHIGVVAREFSLTLSRTSVTAGSASIQLQNFGEDPHDLRVVRIDGTGTPVDFDETPARQNQTRTVPLAPGTYKLYCTLPGHDAWGMHATLTVG